MSLIKAGFAAIGKFIMVLILMAAFLVGMGGVVYMSLRGNEVIIPEIVGKNFDESEMELAALGLKIKRIANRYSEEKPNTVLEQRPRAGETAKTGLMISVIVSQPNPESTEAPADVKKKADEGDIEEIEELISDKPQKSNRTNANTNKKKSSTTRDVIKEKTNQDSNSSESNNSGGNSKTNTSVSQPGSKENKNSAGNSNNKQTSPPSSNKTQSAPVKPPSEETRPRRTPTSN